MDKHNEFKITNCKGSHTKLQIDFHRQKVFYNASGQ